MLFVITMLSNTSSIPFQVYWYLLSHNLSCFNFVLIMQPLEIIILLNSHHGRRTSMRNCFLKLYVQLIIGHGGPINAWMLLIKFGLLVKRIHFFLLWLSWFVLEEGISNSDNFLLLERFFSIYFQPPWVQYPTSSCLLLLILSSFLSSIFLCFFPSRSQFNLRHRFFYLCQPFASQSLISFEDLWLTLLL